MGVAVFGGFLQSLLPAAGRAGRRPEKRSQPPAKGSQRERREVERKFISHTKLRDQKEENQNEGPHPNIQQFPPQNPQDKPVIVCKARQSGD